MRLIFFIGFCGLILSSCSDEQDVDYDNLEDYIALNSSSELADLVSCAGGRAEGMLGSASEPTDVFFYPIDGAIDFRFFETDEVADSLDYTKYIEKNLESEPVFNGYLWKFNNKPFSNERMGIVTYKTPGKLHICRPIRQKTILKPTEMNNALLEVVDNSINPSFEWSDGIIDENVIYFHVISDMENNLISGTYTIEKKFSFYDLSNVVFNMTDPDSMPTLESNTDYKISVMGVSEDNWINVFMEKEFTTE